MKTVRWGLIGCGDVAETKSGPALQRARGSALVAVADRNGTRAESFAQRHGVPRWYDDADALIGASDVDVVYVATKPESHCDLVLRCAAAGKAVLVEKPMAMNALECSAMIDACAKAGVPLWVAFYRRSLPRFIKLRELIAVGAIGTVRMVSTLHTQALPSLEALRTPYWSWRLDPSRSGGGLFFEAACHTLDILDFILGPIGPVRAFSGNVAGVYAGEEIVAAAYRFGGDGFGSGAYGSGAWCFAADRDQEITEIIGSEGRLRFPTFNFLPPSDRSPLLVQLIRGAQTEEFQCEDPVYVHEPFIQSIVDEIHGQGHCPGSAAAALRGMRVIEACLGR